MRSYSNDHINKIYVFIFSEPEPRILLLQRLYLKSLPEVKERAIETNRDLLVEHFHKYTNLHNSE